MISACERTDQEGSSESTFLLYTFTCVAISALRLRETAVLMNRNLLGHFIVFSLIGGSSQACRKDEICDWTDNDRDGYIDEDFDQDGDGHWACGVTLADSLSGLSDCDDSSAVIFPGAEEVCDQEDNDCDSVIDEQCPLPALVQLGLPVTRISAPALPGSETLSTDVIILASKEYQALVWLDKGPDGQYHPGSTYPTTGLYIADAVPLPASQRDPEEAASVELLVTSSSTLAIVSSVNLPEAQEPAPTPLPFILSYRDLGVWFANDPHLSVSLSVQGAPAWESYVTAGTKYDPWSVFTVRTSLALPYEATPYEWPQDLLTDKISDYAYKDVNGDGTADVVLSNGPRVAWLQGGQEPENAQFSAVEFEDTLGGFELIDLDRDSDLDLLVTIPARWRVYQALNDGTGHFGEPQEIDHVLRHPHLIRAVPIQGGICIALAEELSAHVEGVFVPTAGASRSVSTVFAGSGCTTLQSLSQTAGEPSRFLTGHVDGEVTELRGLCQSEPFY